MMKTIKKTLTSLIVLSLFLTPQLKAQNENSGVEIKGGLNFSNSYYHEVDDQNMRTSFHAGMYFKAALNQFLAIQSEVFYSRKASTTKSDNLITGDGESSNN